MNKYDDIKRYITTVCEHIRWKKARLTAADGLETHILDQRGALILTGMESDAAKAPSTASLTGRMPRTKAALRRPKRA